MVNFVDDWLWLDDWLPSLVEDDEEDEDDDAVTSNVVTPFTPMSEWVSECI